MPIETIFHYDIELLRVLIEIRTSSILIGVITNIATDIYHL